MSTRVDARNRADSDDRHHVTDPTCDATVPARDAISPAENRGGPVRRRTGPLRGRSPVPEPGIARAAERRGPDELLDPPAARSELRLDAKEFGLAVELGEVRTVAVGASAPRRRMVPRHEVDRLIAERGFPDALRERLHLVGAVTGAELLGITRTRFACLARAGCFRPARWYVNRYRATVWLYPASDVLGFAGEHEDWLAGRLPKAVREKTRDGVDLRAQGWRARRVEQLVGAAADAWDEAAAWAALLTADDRAGLIADADEHRVLAALVPSLSSVRPGGPPGPAVETAAPLVADDPDEIAFARLSLAHALERARAHGPAPAAPPAPLITPAAWSTRDACAPPNGHTTHTQGTGAATVSGHSTPGEGPHGACCRTVTKRAQRWSWLRGLSHRTRGTRGTGHGASGGAGGAGRSAPDTDRPDQPKGKP
ncbi:DUF6397 family protein [Streptomyces sp. PTM05]|uniref:DUF6397 family protein n=1 Tax=Streptantibioticus parmotrematis TaxID=2873249 RepID=A0ABS7QP59_9ACTN|nr:DUF6397 family protein [Streptantibioticus parmotrematis]MBY8884551.1 DUF6397 family protein [Streptantibioticus parmotrematis]